MFDPMPKMKAHLPGGRQDRRGGPDRGRGDRRQVRGVRRPRASSAARSAPGVTGSTVYEWGNPGLLAERATAAPANTYSDTELLFNAEVAPSNTVGVVGTQRNKKKGTATLNLTLPNPGELNASGGA
jgi:hypothetical protein